MQAFYSNEIKRGFSGIGEYYVLSQYPSVVSGMKEIELISTFSPKEIVKRLQGKIAIDKSSVTTVIANAAPLQGSKEIAPTKELLSILLSCALTVVV